MGLSNKEVFSKYNTVGVCIMSPNYFSVLLALDEEDLHTKDLNEQEIIVNRFCVYDLEREEGDRWGYGGFEGEWISPIAVHTKFEEYLVSDCAGNVYYCGLGENKRVEDKNHGIFGLKNIHGSIYGVAPSRTVYKRLGADKWSVDHRLIALPGAQQTAKKGFEDIDGFSESDIYAVGGDRDVWHFDGDDWSPLDISRRPFRCECVVCAEDGYVYIGGRDGAIARGRGDEWKTYFPEGSEEDFLSIVSYRGRVFAGTEQGTFIIGEDLTPQPYNFEGQLRPIAGRFMYTAYDRLLIASNFNQIAFFDGEKWLDINGCNELTPVEEGRLMNESLELMEKVEKKLIEIAEKNQAKNT